MAARINPSLTEQILILSAVPSQAQPLIRRLALGQLLEGRVLAVRGRQAVLSLLGEQIATETLLPLKVGQVLRLMAREVQPNRITLQVISETEGGTVDFRLPTDQDLANLLAAGRTPADPMNLLIASTLFRQSLPLTRDLVLTIRSALSFIETPTAKDLEAAIFLVLRALPVTPQSLELAKRADLAPNTLGTQVQLLTGQLRDLFARTERGADAAPLRSLLVAAQETLQELPQLAADRPLNPPLPTLVFQLMDRIGTPTERRLARLFQEDGSVASETETPPPIPVAEREPGTAGPRGSAQADLGVAERAVPGRVHQRHHDAAPTLSEQLRPAAEDQGLPLTRQHRAEIMRDFRQQLAFLNDELAEAALLPRQHPASSLLQELLVTVRDLMSTVEVEQLSNAGRPPPTQAQGCYVFHLPVTVPGQHTTETAEVRVYYHGGQSNKRVDPENTHLAFLLEMSRLGSVEVHVDLHKNHLACRIECSNGEAAELFQESSSELQERLQETGYSVDSIRSVISRQAEACSEHSVAPSLSQIDIRA